MEQIKVEYLFNDEKKRNRSIKLNKKTVLNYNKVITGGLRQL